MDNNIVGRKIVGVRPMTREEMILEGWEDSMHHVPMVLLLDNGSRLYPAQDEEGNGPGALFGTAQDGTAFIVYVQEVKGSRAGGANAKK